MSSIGPQLPAHLLQQQSTSDANLNSHTNEDSDSDDGYGPALPPDLAVARSQPTASTSQQTGARTPPHNPTSKAAIGPSFPTGPPPLERDSYEDDSDDDDVGPKPMASLSSEEPNRSGVKEFMEREERRRKELEDKNNPKTLKREEWMLAPPSASDLLGSLDPKKLRTAKKTFSAATSSSRDTTVDNTLWTETPAQRQQRLAEEVSGKRKRATNPDAQLSAREAADKKRRKDLDDDIRQRVDEHTKASRGQSLVEKHAITTKKTASEEEPSAIWDHTRDMSVGGRLLDDRQRSQMITEAKGLSDRFGSGKSGRFI